MPPIGTATVITNQARTSASAGQRHGPRRRRSTRSPLPRIET